MVARIVQPVPLTERALAYGNRALSRATPHRELSLRRVAAECGVTSPALIKHFGSTTGYLSGLAALQWDHLHHALSGVPLDGIARALEYVRWSIMHPGPLRLMYESDLWESTAGTADRGTESNGAANTARWRQEMIAMRDRCFEDIVVAVEATPHPSLPSAVVARLLASLATGLAVEFVYECLFADDVSGKQLRDRQLAHAATLLRTALR